MVCSRSVPGQVLSAGGGEPTCLLSAGGAEGDAAAARAHPLLPLPSAAAAAVYSADPPMNPAPSDPANPKTPHPGVGVGGGGWGGEVTLWGQRGEWSRGEWSRGWGIRGGLHQSQGGAVRCGGVCSAAARAELVWAGVVSQRCVCRCLCRCAYIAPECIIYYL
jgi:hypothetical protein